MEREKYGPYPKPQIDNPLLPLRLHEDLMSLLLDTLTAIGPLATMNSRGIPHAIAASFQAAGLVLTEWEDWTNPAGKIHQYLRKILRYLHQLPELATYNMEICLPWLVHQTGVFYKKLMPLMLPPSTTPAPASAPPPPAPQPTYAASLTSPTPAESRNIKTPRPVRTQPTKAPTTTTRCTDRILSKAIVIRNLHILPIRF